MVGKKKEATLVDYIKRCKGYGIPSFNIIKVVKVTQEKMTPFKNGIQARDVSQPYFDQV